MAREKSMNEAAFAQLVRQKTAFGEMIRTRQEEKQSVMDEYRRELERYRAGQVSRTALATSAKRVKRELTRLDKEIMKSIRGVRDMARRSSQLAERQSPTKFDVTLTGVRKKSATRRKTTTRRKAKTATRKTARKTAARKSTTRRKTTRRKAARKTTARKSTTRRASRAKK